MIVRRRITMATVGVVVALGSPCSRRSPPGRPRSRAGRSRSCSGRSSRRASPSTRRPPSRRCGRPARASTTSSTSTRSRSSRAPTRSSASWPSGGRGRTAGAPGLLPPQGRPLARRPAVHVEGREVHVRHDPGGPGHAGEATLEPAQGLVRQRGGHRGAGPAHGDVPAQAPAALAPRHAGLGILARLPRPRAARRVPHPLRRHRAVQAQGVAARASSSTTCGTRTTSSRDGPTSTASAT